MTVRHATVVARTDIGTAAAGVRHHAVAPRPTVQARAAALRARVPAVGKAALHPTGACGAGGGRPTGRRGGGGAAAAQSVPLASFLLCLGPTGTGRRALRLEKPGERRLLVGQRLLLRAFGNVELHYFDAQTMPLPVPVW